MGPWHFRALEAYFDGNQLIIRSTPLYDMREKKEDDGFMQRLTRWWFGFYVGDTTLFRVDPNLVESGN